MCRFKRIYRNIRNSSYSVLEDKFNEDVVDIDISIWVALIFNLRFLFLSPPPNMVPFDKKIVSEKDYCNRTTGKGADQALKFRIH